jgi:hypothetical protein
MRISEVESGSEVSLQRIIVVNPMPLLRHSTMELDPVLEHCHVQ